MPKKTSPERPLFASQPQSEPGAALLQADDANKENLSPAVREYNDDPEYAHRRASGNLALLIRWMQAEQSCDRGGTNIALEQDAWYAAETLLMEARDVLNCLDSDVDLQERARRAARGAR